MDQERTVTISAELDKTRQDKDVLADVQKFLAGLKVPNDIPQDFQVKLSGKAKEIKENFGGVIFAFILSVMLIYMIMAAQFESFLQPLIIMVTVPLSFGGALIALKVTGTSFNVISLLGLVLLEGVVVGNGIVLMNISTRCVRTGRKWWPRSGKRRASERVPCSCLRQRTLWVCCRWP